MKIIEPSYRINTPFGPLTAEIGIALLRFIEYNARISHKSELAQTEDSWKRFLQAVVVDHGDYSVLEHASFTVIFRIPRGVTHEMVRHRIFGFTQESTRFVNGSKKYPDGLEFILPADAKAAARDRMMEAYRDAEAVYTLLLDSGTRPQEARSVLPNALAATISVTGNVRNWRYFLLARTSKETHPDFKAVTIPLLAELKVLMPLVFDDIEANARQIDNFKKAH